MSSEPPSVTGFNAELGIRILEWEAGRCVMALPIEARHLNRVGVVHGGVLSTLIDAVASHAGNYVRDPAIRARSVTVSLTVQFVGQARGGTLRVVGTRTGGGKRLFFARGEIFDDTATLIACGDVTCRVFT